MVGTDYYMTKKEKPHQNSSPGTPPKNNPAEIANY